MQWCWGNPSSSIRKPSWEKVAAASDKPECHTSCLSGTSCDARIEPYRFWLFECLYRNPNRGQSRNCRRCDDRQSLGPAPAQSGRKLLQSALSNSWKILLWRSTRSGSQNKSSKSHALASLLSYMARLFQLLDLLGSLSGTSNFLFL